MVRFLSRHLSRSHRVKTILMGLYFYISVSVFGFSQGALFAKLKSLFSTKKIEVVLVGCENRFARMPCRHSITF
jgi:hypothetical protein